jgi:endonuclease YncB( thermonuclease family)
MINNYHQDQLEEFKNLDLSIIKNHIFQDLELEAYCYNVHDTDSISILFKYKDEILKHNIRIDGVDAPELNSSIIYEKELCIKGTNYLKNLILNKIIKVKIKKTDKYGRLLADIYTLDLYPNNICINNNLIDEGYCRKYTGGTKIDWNLTSSDILVDINNTNSIVENSPRIKRKYTKKIKN